MKLGPSFLASALAVAAVLAGGPARAEEPASHPSGGSKFFIAVGGYLISLANDARVDTSQGLGTTIDVEGLLGLQDERNLARIEGYWRFKPRHRLDFSYYYVNRDGSKTVDEAFDFDGIHYNANATISSEFKQQYLKTSYRFAFLNDDRIELGLSAGLATFLLDGTIEGDGQVLENGVPTGATSFRRSSNTVVAPVPNFGLYGEFRLVERLVLRQSFDFFALSMDDWRAGYYELRIGIDWRFTQHFGFGVGWDMTRLEYEDGGERALTMQSETSGLVWYFSYSF